MAASPTPPSAPPSKKSIFNKPAWAKSAPASVEPDPEDSTDFFRRSDRTFAVVAAEQEARRKRRKARKEQDAARGSGNEGGAKRQRTTESADEEESTDTKTLPKHHAESRSKGVAKSSTKSPMRSNGSAKPRDSTQSLTKCHEPEPDSIAAAKVELERMMSSNVISLDSDEEMDRVSQKPPKPVATSAPLKRSEIEDLDVSDEEELFPELARKARDNAKQKHMQKDTPKDPKSTTNPIAINESPEPADATKSVSTAKLGESKLISSRPQKPPSDPVVSIFVQSAIPDTTPFILNRKLHQRLKEVRQYWCKRQSFSADVAARVILTWRGRRVFDVASCAALGLEVNEAGKVVIKGESNVFSDDEEDGDAQIHMEAMTEEMFEERQREKYASQRAKGDASDEDEVEEAVEAKKEEQVRIILKSKDYKEFYLLVQPVSIINILPLETSITLAVGAYANPDIVYKSISYNPSLSNREEALCRNGDSSSL